MQFHRVPTNVQKHHRERERGRLSLLLPKKGEKEQKHVKRKRIQVAVMTRFPSLFANYTNAQHALQSKRVYKDSRSSLSDNTSSIHNHNAPPPPHPHPSRPCVNRVCLDGVIRKSLTQSLVCVRAGLLGGGGGGLGGGRSNQ